MPISYKLNPEPNLIFSRIRESLDKSFSFGKDSLPLISDYFYISGVVTNQAGIPVAGTSLSVSISGSPYMVITTLSDGSFTFKLPVSWEETIIVEMSSDYGEEVLYFNYFDILIIAWIYAEQYLRILQSLAQTKQDSYSPPIVGDIIQPLFRTDKDSYTTLERTLKRRFPNWPFTYLNYGSPNFTNFKNLRFWNWNSTFHAGLQALKDITGANHILLIPYDEYRLFHKAVDMRKTASNRVTVSESYLRVSRRTAYFPEKEIMIPLYLKFIDHYIIASLYPNLRYEIWLPPSLSLTVSSSDLFKTKTGDYSDYKGWTYGVPNYYTYRPLSIEKITPPWDPSGELPNASFDELVPDEIQHRVARYWDNYVYDVKILKTFLILGVVRLGWSSIIDIFNYAELIGSQKVDSLDYAGDGELYFVKYSGWTEEEIKTLGPAIEDGNLVSRQFYTLFNLDPTSSILSDLSYKYLDKKWGGILKGFVNFRNI